VTTALLQDPSRRCGKGIDVLAAHADALQDGVCAQGAADGAAEGLGRVPDLVCCIVLADTIRIALGQEDLLQHAKQQELLLDDQLIPTQRHTHNVALIWSWKYKLINELTANLIVSEYIYTHLPK